MRLERVYTALGRRAQGKFACELLDRAWKGVVWEACSSSLFQARGGLLVKSRARLQHDCPLTVVRISAERGPLQTVQTEIVEAEAKLKLLKLEFFVVQDLGSL